jgi:hypothetical protein
MANTYTLIASTSLSSAQANIDFSSIPATYTDLLLKACVRGSDASVQNFVIKFNNSTTNHTLRYLEGNGASASSGTSPGTFSFIGAVPGTGVTASTFNNVEVYIPNYAGSNNKSFSVDAVEENNATTAYADLVAGLWSNTAAINQITIYAAAGNLAQYSTAYLYGVNNA